MPGELFHPPGYELCEDPACLFQGWPAYTGHHLHPISSKSSDSQDSLHTDHKES